MYCFSVYASGQLPTYKVWGQMHFLGHAYKWELELVGDKTWNLLNWDRNMWYALGINCYTHWLCHSHLFLITHLCCQTTPGSFLFFILSCFSSLTNGQIPKGEESSLACWSAAPYHSKSSAAESCRKKFQQKPWILLPSFQGCYLCTSFPSWIPEAFVVVHR
jgi:hypothetical protein